MTAPDAGPPQGDSQEIVVYDPQPVPAMANLFGADNPAEVVEQSAEIAKALTQVINEQGLFTQMGAKRHVNVEAWTLLGSMLGVYPVGEGEPELVEINGVRGFKATVSAQRLDGSVVGRATAFCMADEPNWKGKPIYALAGMAQTRAVSRALRGPLGFIVVLAGFAPTPEAEVPSEPSQPSESKPVSGQQHKLIGALIHELDVGAPLPDDLGPVGDWTSYSRAWIGQQYGKKSRKDLTWDEAGSLIKLLEAHRNAMPV